MPGYKVRAATNDDVDALVRHRISMFSDMGVALDVSAVEHAFRRWLQAALPAQVYRAWLVEDEMREIVAGGGITVIPWPPGPRYLGDQLAFVYNVYTEPAHRRRGLARRVMEAIHTSCREGGVRLVALNASPDGHSLYASMGYRASPNPMMFLALESV